MAKLTLDDLKSGTLPPIGEAPPRHEPKHERPSYRREGLYGHTPFKPSAPPIIVAFTIEQTCKHCGNTSLSMGGLFCEQTDRMGAVVRNRIDYIEKNNIDKVINQHEEVVYCPNCLGKGDDPLKAEAVVNCGGSSHALP